MKSYGANQCVPRRQLENQLQAKMTSSTKPEIYNVFQRSQMMIEPRHRSRNMQREFGKVWMCGSWSMRADRQTDGRTHRNAAGVVARLSMLERDDADDLGRALVHELLTGADWVIYDNYICDRQTDGRTHSSQCCGCCCEAVDAGT